MSPYTDLEVVEARKIAITVRPDVEKENVVATGVIHLLVINARTILSRGAITLLQVDLRGEFVDLSPVQIHF